MTVLFSELLVPGWAEGGDAKIGLDDVTGAYGSDRAFTLPCHNAEPEIFFSDKPEITSYAKTLCAGCPMKKQCLAGAISRKEPCGVWGGQLFEDGQIISAKRLPGRPRLTPAISIVANSRYSRKADERSTLFDEEYLEKLA